MNNERGWTRDQSPNEYQPTLGADQPENKDFIDTDVDPLPALAILSLVDFFKALQCGLADVSQAFRRDSIPNRDAHPGIRRGRDHRTIFATVNDNKWGIYFVPDP